LQNSEIVRNSSKGLKRENRGKGVGKTDMFSARKEGDVRGFSDNLERVG
jgi:hypothetical protein